MTKSEKTLIREYVLRKYANVYGRNVRFVTTPNGEQVLVTTTYAGSRRPLVLFAGYPDVLLRFAKFFYCHKSALVGEPKARFQPVRYD